MNKIRKILIPVDFQDTSLKIVYPASALARHFGSEVLLLHVVAPLGYPPSAFQGGDISNGKDLLSQLADYAQKHLHESVRPAFDGVKVSALVVKGKPAAEIVAVARDQKADLIVMPTHGYSGFFRFLLGSVTAKVIHDSDCPVLTAAHLGGASWSEFAIRHVLCPISFSEHSVSTMKYAAGLAAEFKSRLTFVHVTAGIETFGPGGPYVDKNWKSTLADAALQQIVKLQEEAGTKGEVIVENGDAGPTLDRVAKQNGADLMVVGSHPFAGRRGAHGYQIIAESHIPVLSV